MMISAVIWRRLKLVVSALIIGSGPSGLAWAGPPFLTDDPDPTETSHWEIYGPAAEVGGKGSDYEGAFGVELNYGAAPNVQITLGLPVGFVHEGRSVHYGRGDIEVSVKYRFYHDEDAGFSIALFPGLSLPTASGGLGSSKVTALLPIWAQKDIGPWSVFGGGGYAINPGIENRNYWTGGVALAREITDSLLAGIEIDRQGADTMVGRASTSLGLGGIVDISPQLRLLASAGPTFLDGEGAPGFHAFIALGVNY